MTLVYDRILLCDVLRVCGCVCVRVRAHQNTCRECPCACNCLFPYNSYMHRVIATRVLLVSLD